MPFEEPPLKHRGTGLSFKTLSRGIENTPENHYLSIARQSEFYSPVHRHNFDQFRFALKGDVSLGPDMVLKEGLLSYHPEGAYYGPQKDDPGTEKIVLVLQCGGASGQGYMSFSTLAQANKDLTAVGKFEGGKYYPTEGGEKDGYQALWEHVNGRELEYPNPRYQAPIIIDPDSFKWRKTSQKGAWMKPLGVFSERELRVDQVKLVKEGSWKVGSENAIHLVFVMEGKGHVGSEEVLEETALHLGATTTTTLVAESNEMLLLHFILPLLSENDL